MTAPTDRELLEAAAKAAGIRLADEAMYDEDVGIETYDGVAWSPLTDDGDALRLAVKLKLNVILEYSPTYHYAENDEYEALEDENGCCTRASECNDDPYAATRRAIVRAAADIGRQMP